MEETLSEEAPAEGGVPMGCSEDLTSLLHTARYKCHNRLRLCTGMHPVDNKNTDVHYTNEHMPNEQQGYVAESFCPCKQTVL